MTVSLVRPGRFIGLEPWRIVEAMDRTFWGAGPLSGSGLGAPADAPVDLYETADDVLVAASLPGVDASKVQLSVEHGVLTITGEQPPLMQAGNETGVSRHYAGIRRYGNFTFSVTLPSEVETEHAEARYVDGILRIRFPKVQAAKPLRIPVTVDAAPATKEIASEQTAEA